MATRSASEVVSVVCGQTDSRDWNAPVLMIMSGLACTIFASASVRGSNLKYGQPLADNQDITVERWMELGDGGAPLQDSNNIIFCCQSLILGPLLIVWGTYLFRINNETND